MIPVLILHVFHFLQYPVACFFRIFSDKWWSILSLMHRDYAVLLSVIDMCALQNELQSGEGKPNIFHQSRELHEQLAFIQML